MNGMIVKTYHSDRVVYVLKRCSTCGKRKPLGAFSPDKRRSYGVACVCKECYNLRRREERSTEEGKAKRRIEHTKYLLDPAHKENKKRIDEKARRNPNGVITTLFWHMKRRSKKRKHAAPKFTKVQLTKWLYANGFKELYDAWVASGYDKWMKPSCDRIDDYKGYSLDNIRLTTWKANKDKQTEDILLHRSTSGERCKTTQRTDASGKVLKEWVSLNAARRETGILALDHYIHTAKQAPDGYFYRYAN